MRKYICDILAVLVILIASVSAFGWIFHIHSYISYRYNCPTMKPWTIIAAIICALHCISRSIIQRTNDRCTMLSAVGFSYACVLLLFLWTYTVGLLLIFQYANDQHIRLTARLSIGNNLPCLMTIAGLTAYGITGFCTRYSWSVGSILVLVGTLSNFGFLFSVDNLQWIAPNTAICFVLLGSAIFVARRRGSHWFISECRDALRGL